MNPFAIRLRELRKAKGLRQSDLAKIIGVKTGTVSTYEVGKNYPSSEVLMKLANYFNVSIDYLMGQSISPTIDTKPIDELISDVEVLFYNNGHALSPEKKKILARIIKATIEDEP